MMVDLLLVQCARWAALVALCGLPFVLSLTGLLLHRVARFRRRGHVLAVSAGPWLEERVTARGLPVRVEVHAREGLDAYIPGVEVIGLSERTFAGRRPGDFAIAAHELGHALNMATHPVVAQVLPVARLAQGLLWRGFCAALLCGAFLAEPLLVELAFGLLVAAVGVSAIVCADEVTASRHGYRLLREEPRLGCADRRVALASMASAGSVYLLGLLGQVSALVLWPRVTQLLPGLVGRMEVLPAPAAMWLAVVLVPVLLLRAAHVMSQVLAPEPVTTDFRLFTVMHREGQWEFLTGVGALALVLGQHPQLEGPLSAIALGLASLTAIGPAGGLLGAFVLFPLLLLVKPWLSGGSRAEDEDLFGRPPAPDEAAPALMALYTDPPWYLRLGWLAQLAYLPLIALLLGQMLA